MKCQCSSQLFFFLILSNFVWIFIFFILTFICLLFVQLHEMLFFLFCLNNRMVSCCNIAMQLHQTLNTIQSFHLTQWFLVSFMFWHVPVLCFFLQLNIIQCYIQTYCIQQSKSSQQPRIWYGSVVSAHLICIPFLPQQNKDIDRYLLW